MLTFFIFIFNRKLGCLMIDTFRSLCPRKKIAIKLLSLKPEEPENSCSLSPLPCSTNRNAAVPSASAAPALAGHNSGVRALAKGSADAGHNSGVRALAKVSTDAVNKSGVRAPAKAVALKTSDSLVVFR